MTGALSCEETFDPEPDEPWEISDRERGERETSIVESPPNPDPEPRRRPIRDRFQIDSVFEQPSPPLLRPRGSSARVLPVLIDEESSDEPPDEAPPAQMLDRHSRPDRLGERETQARFNDRLEREATNARLDKLIELMGLFVIELRSSRSAPVLQDPAAIEYPEPVRKLIAAAMTGTAQGWLDAGTIVHEEWERVRKSI